MFCRLSSAMSGLAKRRAKTDTAAVSPHQRRPAAAAEIMTATHAVTAVTTSPSSWIWRKDSAAIGLIKRRELGGYTKPRPPMALGV